MSRTKDDHLLKSRPKRGAKISFTVCVQDKGDAGKDAGDHHF